MKIEAQGTLFVVAAPSGAGKSTLVNALLEREPAISLSVSHTTRPPRPGEQYGRHYYFVERAEFEREAAEGKVRELKEAEANARRSLEQLTASSQLKQTTEPAVVDVYQHTRYETNEPGVAVEPAEDESKGLMDKIGEGIKKLF